MLRLSVNLLSNAMGLLRELHSFANSSLFETGVSYQAFSVNAETIIEIAKTCNWIAIEETRPRLTTRGEEIVSQGAYGLTQGSVRMMLEDYLFQIRPIWRNRIPSGRKEACIFMSKDEKACFVEAGLLSDELSPSVVAWWDQVSGLIRNEKASTNLSTGRIGEKLTICYEKNRTNRDPQWVAIESNKLGYDVLSQVSASDNTKALIEVKTSTEPVENAFFYVSKNEWNVAINSKCYFFYLWSILPNSNQLAVLTPNRIADHIPINQKNGEWEKVRIPYKEYLTEFTAV